LEKFSAVNPHFSTDLNNLFFRQNFDFSGCEQLLMAGENSFNTSHLAVIFRVNKLL